MSDMAVVESLQVPWENPFPPIMMTCLEALSYPPDMPYRAVGVVVFWAGELICVDPETNCQMEVV